MGFLRGNRPGLVRTFPGVPPPRSQLSRRGSEKSGGGDGHREPPALPGGRGRELTGTEGGGGGKSAGPGSCAAPGASQRGCGGRNRHRKLQTLPNAPAITARRGGGGRLGSGVSPRHPAREGEGAAPLCPGPPRVPLSSGRRERVAASPAEERPALPAPPRRCTGA